MKILRPPRVLALSWLALVVLLGLTVTISYQPLGAFNSPIALAIATMKALIVALVFMELRHSRGLLLAVASAGLCWLSILIWLTMTDITWRAGFPPTLGVRQITAPPGAEPPARPL